MDRASAARVVVVAMSLALLVRPASAQEGIFTGMQKNVESVFSSVSTTTTFASGQVVKTDTTDVSPAFRITIDSLVYPNLRLNAGGVFEMDMFSTRTNGVTTDSTISRNRPFFQVRSTNPVLSPGFGYFRREDRSRTQGFAGIKLVNEEYAGYLGWNPAGGPRNDFQFLKTDTYDGDRALQDISRKFGSIASNYTLGNLSAYYRGAYLDTDDRSHRLKTTQVSHAGRSAYSDAFLKGRLVWNGTYNVSYQDLRTVAEGEGGEVDLPVTPFAGLTALADTAVTATLSQAPPLVDGNLTAGAGIDIGLAVSPENTQARNIGLDFLNPTEVNRILIWVDRELPVEVSNAFSWEIYSSRDNVLWTREAAMPFAPFGPFENRFEITFPAFAARYVKVVTRPLSPVVPESSRFVDILITEMQAFLRRPAGDLSGRIEQTTHLVNTDVRMRILDAPSVFYEGFFLYNGPSTFGSSTRTLSNGVSVNHTFARIFSAYARAAREQGTEPRGERVATITNATFTVEPIPTLRSSLLYNRQDERIDHMPTGRTGFFVQNAAQIYRGIDVLFGIGWNSATLENGATLRDRLVNVSGTIVPREHASLTFAYNKRKTQRLDQALGSFVADEQRVYAAFAVDPIRTLHLVLGADVLAVTDQRTRTTFDVGANWAPFPDGALQFVFAHNEALRALEFGQDRSTLGVVRWNISRRSYIDVSWQKTKSEFVFQATETRMFTVSVRLYF